MQKFNLTMRGSSCYQLSLPFQTLALRWIQRRIFRSEVEGTGGRTTIRCKKPLSALTLPLQRTYALPFLHSPSPSPRHSPSKESTTAPRIRDNKFSKPNATRLPSPDPRRARHSRSGSGSAELFQLCFSGGGAGNSVRRSSRSAKRNASPFHSKVSPPTPTPTSPLQVHQISLSRNSQKSILPFGGLDPKPTISPPN